MSIMTRFIRLCKADVHGVMDQLEDKGLLLKQCLRDMEEELARKEQALNRAISAKQKAVRDLEKYSGEIENIEHDLEIAIQKDKDDISRFLIKKIKPLASHKEELQRHIDATDRDIAGHTQCLDEQRRQKDEIQLQAAEYFRRSEREQWEKTLSDSLFKKSASAPSDEEIEMELLRRKESVKKGGDDL